jgi:hypothetical protein
VRIESTTGCVQIANISSLEVMKYEVRLYVGGKVFIEEVYATNPKDARETALTRNPKATILGLSPLLK